MITHKFRSVGSGHWSGLRLIRSGPKSGQSLYGLANTHLLVWPFRPDQNVGIGQTKQTKTWVLARPNRPKYGYSPDRTDQNCHWPDGRLDPNIFQTIVDGCTGPTCPRPKSVWSKPVLGRGLHPGIASSSHQTQKNMSQAMQNSYI